MYFANHADIILYDDSDWDGELPYESPADFSPGTEE